MAIDLNTAPQARFPLLTLLHPQAHSRLMIGMLTVGVIVGILGATLIGLPLWVTALMTLVLLLYPALAKWRDDERH
jgi:hypothetical protein